MTLYDDFRIRHEALLNSAELALAVTEAICTRMHDLDLTTAELADRSGVPELKLRAFLDGESSISLAAVANIFTALNQRVEFHVVR